MKKSLRVGDKHALANGIEATFGGKSKRLTKKRILEIAAETCAICAKELERSRKNLG